MFIETGVFCFYAFVYSTRTHDQFTVRRSSTITYRLNMTVNVKFFFPFVLLSSIGDELKCVVENAFRFMTLLLDFIIFCIKSFVDGSVFYAFVLD